MLKFEECVCTERGVRFNRCTELECVCVAVRRTSGTLPCSSSSSYFPSCYFSEVSSRRFDEGETIH